MCGYYKCTGLSLLVPLLVIYDGVGKLLSMVPDTRRNMHCVCPANIYMDTLIGTCYEHTCPGPDGLDIDNSNVAFIRLAVVACGMDRFNETMTMLKSAAVFTHTTLMFYIFADPELSPKFAKELELWPSGVKDRIQYKILPVQFPKENEKAWRSLFVPCGSQRLFLPSILTDVEKILYIDTDVLFFRPLEDIWSFWDKMKPEQIAAVTPEHEEGNAGWYNRFARHPYYGKLGVNSGVMLMNLAKMRENHWIDKMIEYYKIYHYNITWGDQDLINIYFHFHPDRLYVYPCEWNFRPDHCMYMMNCESAVRNGVAIVHGNRRVFHNDKQPAFKAIFIAMYKYNFGEDMDKQLLQKMIKNLKRSKSASTYCGKEHAAIVKQLTKTIWAVKKEKT